MWLHLKNALMTGGFTLAVIGILSIICVFILFERILATRNLASLVRSLTDQVIKTIYQNDWEQAKQRCQQSPYEFSHMFYAALHRVSLKKTGVHSTFERERALFNQSLRKNLWLLGTIGTSAPFIGLFGTVIGIMQSFQDIADSGGGGFAVVSRGLSEALITTACGIIVAVEAVVFYNYLQTRISRLIFTVRLAGEEFLEALNDVSQSNS